MDQLPTSHWVVGSDGVTYYIGCDMLPLRYFLLIPSCSAPQSESSDGNGYAL